MINTKRLVSELPNDASLGEALRATQNNTNDLIHKITWSNDTKYNYLKCVEELTELSEVLMKRTLKEKTDKNPTNESIIEEIGDVEIRLEILKEMLNCHDAVEQRIAVKSNKYITYIKEGKFKGNI